MPDIPHPARTAVQLLRAGLRASREQGSHIQQAFGGWDECKACEKANDECDGAFACDAYKDWQKAMEAADRSGAELAVDQLLAELTETRTKLEIAERQNRELTDLLELYVGHEPTVAEEMAYLNSELTRLESALAERDEQIAGLLAAEPTLDDDQPGVPL